MQVVNGPSCQIHNKAIWVGDTKHKYLGVVVIIVITFLIPSDVVDLLLHWASFQVSSYACSVTFNYPSCGFSSFLVWSFWSSSRHVEKALYSACNMYELTQPVPRHRKTPGSREQLWLTLIHHEHISLYSLIWYFLLSQINIWTTTTWSNVWVVLPKPPWYEFLIGFLIWTPALKYLHLTTFSNICVILSMFLYL